ncbi:MAG: hypothetical protein ACE5EE_11175 [Fidelibacterota bacterium]
MNSELSAINMDKSAFFKYEISEILNPEKKIDQPNGLREQVESFVRDCAGAADGDMDISFQENGRGYYAHLYELERLKGIGLDGYLEYRDKLLSEIKEAEGNGEMTHQMKVVYDQLSSEEG